MRVLASLTNRIFLASALVGVLCTGAAIYVVNARVTAQAESDLRRGLEDATALVERHRVFLIDQFAAQARFVADLPKLKAAVELDHPPTVQPLAEDYWRSVQADLFVVTGRAGRPLAVLGGHDLVGGPIDALPAVRSAVAGRETTSFWSSARGPLQVVTVPIWIDPALPEILGTLSVGVRLDEPLAARLKSLTAAEIAFASDGRVHASTLPRADWPAIGELLSERGVTHVRLGQEEYVALARPIEARDTAHHPVAVVLRSRTERLRVLSSLHTALAATGVAAVLIATLLSYLVARTVTRPLAAIMATMHEMTATGDLTRKIELSGDAWTDEDARLLARTLNALTASTVRFQREAAQRERLSSLGRLSTVVAHEIRNPLMIIKAALRRLRRAGEGDQQASAIADIDEEIGRLNRIVNEVLDFARPIQFDYAEADLNALCRDAAVAALGAAPDDSFRLRLDPAAAAVVTDAERLRLALVNIVTNARHAVDARGETAAVERGGDPDIELTTTALDGSRVRIGVRDRGVGIAPEDVPRVFDPYFTTKRTGSGLGLAIAKNIVEGLGGTIAVSRAPGTGTEITIELPRRR
jgi:signal transduction histidine kinase